MMWQRAWFLVMGGWLVRSVPVLAAMYLVFAHGLTQAQSTPGRGLQPLVGKAQGGQCVDDPAFMRRNHMTLLKHQRDDTMHGGVRTGKYSLKACVACHASQTSQSVAAEKGDFCQSCHTFAAVKIDCFECHASKPPAKGAQPVVSQKLPVGPSPGIQLTQMLSLQQAKP
jgi:hypothetical protein